MTLSEVMQAHPNLTAAGFKFAPSDAERQELAAQGEQFAYCADWLKQLQPGRSLLGAKPASFLLKLAARGAPCKLSLGVLIAAVIADGRFRWRRNSEDGGAAVAAVGDFAGLKRMAKHG